MSDGPSDLPKLEELEDLLRKPLPIRVPVAAAALRLLNRSARHFDLDYAGSLLSVAVSAAVIRDAPVGGEQLTATYVDVVVVGTLLALDTVLPLEQRLHLDLQRDSAGSTSPTASESDFGHSLRSDLMLRDAST